MEHRWGQRRYVDFTVRVGADPRSLHLARLMSVSVSGAFLWTSLPLASLHTVYVATVNSRFPDLMEGRVVRGTEQGIGIEWTEFAPAPVLKMLQELEPMNAGVVGPVSEAPALGRLG